MEQVKHLLVTFFPDKAAKVVNLILLMLLAWSLGKIAWGLFEKPSIVTPTAVSSYSPSEKEVIDYNLSDMLRYHLFGKYMKQETIKPKTVDLTNLPLSRMNLKLVGVVASTIEERSTAIISNKNVQGVYGVNDKIKGTNVNLRYILTDRVILNNNGRDETLMLEGVDYVQMSNATFSNKKSEQPAKTVNVNNDKDLQQIRQEIIKSPQSLLKYITLAQEKNEDKILGYLLGAGSDKRLFESAGLQQGDIAVEINNVDLTDPAQMNLIWTNLKNASEISLSVLRGGQIHHINIGL